MTGRSNALDGIVAMREVCDCAGGALWHCVVSGRVG